jgi:hypothetical protein
LDLDLGSDSEGIPPLILENCAATFAFPICLFFNRSLATCIYPNGWKLSIVTSIFKSGRCNDISNNRAIAILSAIAELLVYRVMYEDLRGRYA